jgi:2,4-dienoyl-CoA reductase-like NADH-dependent reductase (Old Yellow Enzyme family)
MSVLFEPVKIKNLEVHNRFVRSATYDGMADRSGRVSDHQIRLYQDLAAGGTGLIVSGVAPVHPSGQLSATQNAIYSDEFIPGLKRLTDTVHRYDAKIVVQLFHGGRERAKIYTRSKRCFGPSVVENDPYFPVPYQALTEDLIWEIIRAFGDGARRAMEAGFDGIQLHGAHAYLLSQFLSPFCNRRTDAWGGPLENRLRFHHEIYREVRAKVGDDYPVMIKLGVADGFPEGLTFTEGKAAAAKMAEWGFDALEISSGLRGKGYHQAEFHTQISSLEKEAYFREWAREIKQAVSVPVMMVGGLRTFSLMEEVVENGEADFVSLSRPLIREPGLIRDWKGGDRHRATCISCNKCFEAILKGEPVHCVVQKREREKQQAGGASPDAGS